jgi:capsular polysaccharide transport system permease protein
MTTKPRAKKFRIRRSALFGAVSAAARAEAAADRPGPGPEAAGLPEPAAGRGGPAAAAAEATSPAAVSAEAELEAIRAEGLTGRQLRMARRVAARHGIEATSDFEAVRLLRARGIDPFRHANMLELVVGADDDERPAPGAVQLPRTVAPAQPQLPRTAPPKPAPSATEVREAEERRAREILQIQRDIARRRRRRMLLLFARLAVFVLLPTFAAGYYYSVLATPMYATRSEFVIQKAEAQGATGLGSLFSGTAMATAHDSITVQGYLQSREAMLRLDADHGFKAHFSQPWIDPLQRLPEGASNEEAYRLYQRNVKISFDPTEGVVKMEVIAADPEVSATFSRALIGYAEEQVDHLTQRLREDQMQGARESYEQAEANVRAAQARVVELQEARGVLSAQAEVSSLMSQISTFEVQLRQERLALEQLLANPRPNETRVQVARDNIARLEALIAEMRAQMTASGTDGASLARITSELTIAEADLQTRQALLAQALQQLESARIEANRQVRYLSMGVSPVPPDEPTYPRAFENTLVALLIFGGIYLMISLTASILREQVAA